jgi:O-antigen ligase
LKNAASIVGFLAFCHVVGMIFSPFLQSFTLILIGSFALIRFLLHTEDKRKFWSSYGQRMDYWILGFIFFEVAMGVLNALDMPYLLERIRLRIPFIGLPFAFFLLPVWSRANYRNWWIAVLLFLQIVAVGVMVHYFLNREEIQLLLQQGKAIPTPANHIRYALLQVIAFCASVYWGWWQRDKSDQRFTDIFFKFSALFFFLFIHFLAVRSGIFSVYFILFCFGIPILWVKKAYPALIAFLAGMILLPFIALKTIPSLKQKMGYVYYDIDQFLKGEGTDQLSDASRLISLKMGIELFKKNPIVGVGAGNIRIKMNALYQRDYPSFKKKLTPHNQFIMVLASSGIVGFCLFCIGFFVPLFVGNNFRDPLILAIYLSFFASFMGEATFENAMGVAIFLFFTLLHLNQKKISHA